MQHYVPLVCLVVMSFLHPRVHGFEWRGNWAMDCDFLGNELSDAEMPGDQCGPSCAWTSGCTHFTWTNHNGGTCWMKRGGVSKSQAVHHQGAVCGVNSDPEVHGFDWQGNWAMQCDFFGNDMSNAQMPGEQCGASCATTSGCTHFTWTDHNNGTCWMKRGGVSKSQAVFHHGAVCGVNG